VEIDLVWLLLLPVIFALGWMTARYDWGQQRRESRHVPTDILQGISFLLAGEAERATDSLLSAARSSPDDTALHQAVGNLYRQRGLIDRAIEVHEAALQHPGLDAPVRCGLMLDLSRDYLAAGLLDRAEDVLIDLLNHASDQNDLANTARLLLMKVAHRTRDWARAIFWAEEARQHEANFRGMQYEQLMGHFYCERVEQALSENDSIAAAQALTMAQTFDAPGPTERAAFLRSRMAGSVRDPDALPTAPSGVFACTTCGFRSKIRQWGCPGCHEWDSFRLSRL